MTVKRRLSITPNNIVAMDKEIKYPKCGYEIGKAEKNLPNTLYHYTSIDKLFKILEKAQKFDDTITMWASHTAFMNDPSEFDYLFQAIRGQQSIEMQEWMNKERHTQNLLYTEPFLCCFSENDNSLPMWNTYGQRGKGVAVGFEYRVLQDSISELNKGQKKDEQWKLEQCKYIAPNYIEDSKEINELEDMFDELKKRDDEFNTDKTELYEKARNGQWETYKSKMEEIIAERVITKHKAYDYEKEWRLYKVLNRVPLITGTPIGECQHREDKGLKVPYLEIEIPIQAIQEIVVGPTAHYDRACASLEFILNSKGLRKIVPVIPSDIPYTNE